MKIIIECAGKEIADLIRNLQGQRTEDAGWLDTGGIKIKPCSENTFKSEEFSGLNNKSEV